MTISRQLPEVHLEELGQRSRVQAPCHALTGHRPIDTACRSGTAMSRTRPPQSGGPQEGGPP